MTVDDDYREIRRYDWDSAESEALAVPLEGGQDYAWTPDGMILMAIDGELYGYRPGVSVDWDLIADLELNGTTRLAVSGDLAKFDEMLSKLERVAAPDGQTYDGVGASGGGNGLGRRALTSVIPLPSSTISGVVSLSRMPLFFSFPKIIGRPCSR